MRRATTLHSERAYRIEPEPQYTPQIGALVEMMNYARLTTLQAVEGLTTEQLDTVPGGFGNSIGMLLAHIAAVDRVYQMMSFEGRDFGEMDGAIMGGLSMWKEGTPPPTGQSLDTLLAELDAARKLTLDTFATKDDDWLASRLPAPYDDMSVISGRPKGRAPGQRIRPVRTATGS
ncbi:DinB family protein [Deinococcus radiopugnans]|uniref:DinB family protein n=1 Tax=Deinococcus radiopugnans TaxID=57497 RepID=UPI00068A8358|nr:DinB family protein [Deinococcus radiopugnans]